MYWSLVSKSIEFGGLFNKWSSCAKAYSHFWEVQSKFSRYKSRNLWQGFIWGFMLLALKKVRLTVAELQHYCSYLQHLKVGNCTAKLLPRASKAAQHFCIPLQLELSCCLASKMLLKSCNLAVQLFWSDFVLLYSIASFVRVFTNSSQEKTCVQLCLLF